MHHTKALIVLAVIALTTSEANGSCGKFRFANNFGDHMVLQRSPTQAIIWGYASQEGEKVTVTLQGQEVITYSFKAPSGSVIWEAYLEPVSDKGPYTITASISTCSIELEDILFGDVWVCSGQSNMQMEMWKIDDPEDDIADSVNYQEVRTFFPSREFTDTPREEIRKAQQPWGTPTAERVKYFSAVCWMFGRNLYRKYGRPIGLIQVAQGGSRIEAWSSPEALEKCFENGVAPDDQSKFNNPSWMWNALITPLLKMPIYGVAWYQGESNKGNYGSYGCAVSTMIEDWRARWHSATGGQTQRHFPFGQVQIGPRTFTGSTVSAELRWQQTCSEGLTPNECLPNVFTAVAMDLVDAKSPHGPIHPRYKRPVAERLSLGAFQYAYGDSSEGSSRGPFPTSLMRAGPRLTVRYDNEQNNLNIKSDDNFQVCCSLSPTTCGRWIDARITEIDLKGKLGLHVRCGPGEHVTGVRYAWIESPCQYMQCAVYSTNHDLPAPPFKYERLFPQGEQIQIGH